MRACAPTESEEPSRILLAEDDEEMRRVVSDALHDDGYEVIELVDGAGLAKMASNLGEETGVDSIDLIVSDIRMPSFTGLQLLEQLRRAHRRTPVILMTAFGDEATRKRAESLMAVLFDKPFEVDNLRTTVAKMLPRRTR
jgi:two-component system response regulator (stage 0 sporulation protein F)